MTRRGDRTASPAGVSLVEMLIGAAVMLAVTGVVASIGMRAQATFRVQPEVADMQQRLRVAVSMLGADLAMAGAGPATSALPGSLALHLPAVAPYRRGQSDEGARTGFYRPDALNVMYVPATRAESGVRRVVDLGAELLVEPTANCGALVLERVCGFAAGMRIVLFDDVGAYDLGTVTKVDGDVLHVEHAGALASAHAAGRSAVAEVVAATYGLKPDPATGAFQLVRHDGYQTERPVIDNVVGLRIDYSGDPLPPRLLPALDPFTIRPVTSYGPPPPEPGVDDPRENWGAGENCVFVADWRGPRPRLPVLAGGPSAVPLDPASLRDGPWCPDDGSPVRFDADLLRVRRVRVRLRVQVAVAAMRGPAGRLFTRGGISTSSEYFAPDQEITFDVTTRNMGLLP